ncbi:LegC family aminotransferase [Paenibacillus antri]|uniref:LegC family aminotransferase n=1 Tax=Paenibacillus antri TaxID=2582848 RepID=A0A5R9G6A0_9BACL|nr:LegC family aminotransferase [Paenibacillus antri]TLS50579.1 LegC family aminotransferase [Paenibacillus antri]
MTPNQSTQLSNDIIAALRKALPNTDNAFTPLHEPTFRGNEWTYVKECIDTGWVSSVGSYVTRIEEMIAEITGAKYAVAVVNGTAALHVALLLAGVMPGDEVLLPALTFVATANAVRYTGAVPHFVDIDSATLGVDARKLGNYLYEIAERRSDGWYNKGTGARLRAVVPMHTFGHPADLEPLQRICERFGLVLVEDAAESLGSYYKGKHTGTFGTIAALSFNGNKIVTTGGGGAILTDDQAIARRAKHLTTTAKLPHAWEYSHDEIGFNYRMPNLNAALGCAQLEQLPRFLESKRALYLKYEQAFSAVEGVSLFKEPEYASSNYWLQTLILDESAASARDVILELTNQAGLMTRPAWKLMTHLPMYAGCPSMDLSVSRSLEARIINIPSGSALGA